jgi:hypothetical protein
LCTKVQLKDVEKTSLTVRLMFLQIH